MTDFDQPYRRTRTHHVVEHGAPPTMRVEAYDEVEPWADEDDARPFVGVDPRLVRVGAIAAAAVLMIPIALALREDDSGELRSEPSAVTTTIPAVAPPTPTVVAVPITAAAVAPAPVVAADPDADGASVLAVAAVEPPECAGTYTVVFNDFWNRFPATSGASVDEWLSANGATHDTPLYVGDELCIPEGASAPAAAPTTAPPPPPTTAAPQATAAPQTTAPQTTAPPPPATTAAPPPPAPVATSPPPAATAPGAALTPAQVEALIREIWPDDLEERALTIAKRESGLRSWVNNWCCYGVFAIYFEMGKSWLADLGVTSAAQLYDARTNVQAAYHLYTLSGWAPWRQTDPGS